MTKDNPNAAAEVDVLLAKIAGKAKDAGVTLSAGASERVIQEAEDTFGFSLPGEVKAFYRKYNGSEDEPAVEGRELLSIERMVSEWKIWKGLLDKGDFGDNDHGEPGQGVQKKWSTRQERSRSGRWPAALRRRFERSSTIGCASARPR